MDNETELLVVKKDRERLKFKTVKRHHAGWSPNKYEKIVSGKDYHLLAYLFYDLFSMGYPIEKAYNEFKRLANEPDLFFLK